MIQTNKQTCHVTDPVEVECDMETDPHNVITLVHNNAEQYIYVTGFERPDSYQRNISYFISTDHIGAIKDYSSHCKQHMEIACHWADALEDSHWISFNGQSLGYHTADRPCTCLLEKACLEGRSK